MQSKCVHKIAGHKKHKLFKSLCLPWMQVRAKGAFEVKVPCRVDRQISHPGHRCTQLKAGQKTHRLFKNSCLPWMQVIAQGVLEVKVPCRVDRQI